MLTPYGAYIGTYRRAPMCTREGFVAGREANQSANESEFTRNHDDTVGQTNLLKGLSTSGIFWGLVSLVPLSPR